VLWSHRVNSVTKIAVPTELLGLRQDYHAPAAPGEYGHHRQAHEQ
jgi:hypothetical protein